MVRKTKFLDEKNCNCQSWVNQIEFFEPRKKEESNCVCPLIGGQILTKGKIFGGPGKFSFTMVSGRFLDSFGLIQQENVQHQF